MTARRLGVERGPDAAVARERVLGTPHLVAYYVSSLVGAGILVIPAMAAEIAGPAAILAWAALIVCSYPTAYVFARISLAAPDSSGIIKFVGQVLGTSVANLLALLLLSTLFVGIPVIGLAGARYLCHLLGLGNAGGVVYHLLAMFSVACNVAFNMMGLKLGSKAQTALLASLIVLLVVVLLIAAPAGDVGRLTPFFPHGYAAVGFAAVVCFFCFLGWENVSTVAEDVRDPERTFPVAIRWSLVVVGLLYLAIALVFALVVRPGEVGGNYAVLTHMLRGRDASMGKVSSLLSFVLLFLSGNIWVLAEARLCFALSRDGVLPTWLSRGVRPGGTPRLVLAVLGACFVTVLTLSMLTGSSEQFLIKSANLNFLVVYLAAFAAAAIRFRDRPGRTQALIAFAVNAAFLPFCVDGIGVSAATILAIVAYLAVRRWSSRAATAPNVQHVGVAAAAPDDAA